jgi:hypothetical protein
VGHGRGASSKKKPRNAPGPQTHPPRTRRKPADEKNRLDRLPSKSTARERMKDSVRIGRELKKILKESLKLPQKT